MDMPFMLRMASWKPPKSKTFDDLAKGRETKDLIFPDRVSARVIKNDVGTDITADSVFVAEPYNADFSSEKTSLLVNSEVKRKYDDALKKRLQLNSLPCLQN